MNFARFSHTFAYSHVISALQKAYLSATCICLIKLLWLVSTCFCVQVAHHSKTLVQVCFCFIVCDYTDTLQKVCFFIKRIAPCAFQAAVLENKTCSVLLLILNFARFSHSVAYSHVTSALQKAWYVFVTLHLPNFHTQLLTVMVSQPCKRPDTSSAYHTFVRHHVIPALQKAHSTKLHNQTSVNISNNYIACNLKKNS